jgi:hypothetical protein
MKGKESKNRKAEAIRQGLTTKEKRKTTINRNINKKLKTIVAGLLICSFFSTTLVAATQTFSENEKKDSPLGPDIILTKNSLPMLQYAVQNIKNSMCQKIIKAIIVKIENNGKVNSIDIRTILGELNSTYDIRYGIIAGKGGGDLSNIPRYFPGYLRGALWGCFFSESIFFCKGAVMTWYLLGPLKIGNISYTKSAGFALGYVGLVHTVGDIRRLTFNSVLCGVAPLIFVQGNLSEIKQ